MPLSRFLARRIVTHQTSEAMHIQGNHGQSDSVGKSVWAFRPNTVEATLFKIVDGRLYSGVLTAHGSKGFTLFATPPSLAEVVNLLSKVTPFCRPIMAPTAGRKDSWRGAAAGPARRTNHPNPFYADHPWLPFHRYPVRRSIYNQRGGLNLD